MRLINVKTFEMREFADPPRYAILSHRWTAEELAFQDYHKLHELNTAGAEKVKQFCAFVRTLSSSTFPEDKKIQICTEWAWIDTCCIDKRSSSELNEAINSMWTWYSDAYYCVAYLKDVQMSRNRCESQDLTQAAAEESLISNSGLSHALDFTQMATPPMLKTEVVQSEWFTRGWTLQELLAPDEVVFCNKNWDAIGRKRDPSFCEIITLASSVPTRHLTERWTVAFASMAQKLSWASERVTTRVEDIAYSLLGLCDVNMPLMYGEGNNAFLRLQEEIIKQSDDESILAWTTYMSFPLVTDVSGRCKTKRALADHPRDFGRSQNVHRIDKVARQPYSITNKGLLFIADAAYVEHLSVYVVQLNCAEGVLNVDPEVNYVSHDATPCLIALQEDPDRRGLFLRVDCNTLDLRSWDSMVESLDANEFRYVENKHFLIVIRPMHRWHTQGQIARAFHSKRPPHLVGQPPSRTVQRLFANQKKLS